MPTVTPFYSKGSGLPPVEQRAFEPRGAAELLLYDKRPEIILDGPAGTGKSRGCLEKGWILANKYPGSRGLIVRKTRASLTEAALVTFEQHVVPANHPCIQNQQRRVRQSYVLANGSEIIVAGLDKPDKIMSTEFDWIYVQEARELQLQDHEALTTRLRNGRMPYQQLFGDTNPDAPMHWIKQRERDGKLVLHQSRHQDNPTLWSKSKNDWTERGRIYIDRLMALTGVRLARLYRGEWVSSENTIYGDCWDERIHHVNRFPLRKSWRRFIVCDFGFVNPFCAIWFAVDDDGRIIGYRELYGTQREVRDWGHDLAYYSRRETISAVITDHDSEDRAELEHHMTHTADECDDYVRGKLRAINEPMNRIKVGTTPAYKTVHAGITAVKARMAPARDGLPRFTMMRDSLVQRDQWLIDFNKPTCSTEEVMNYRRDTANSVEYGKVILEEPLKQDDHGMDVWRYAVMHEDDPRAGLASAVGQTARLGRR